MKWFIGIYGDDYVRPATRYFPSLVAAGVFGLWVPGNLAEFNDASKGILGKLGIGGCTFRSVKRFSFGGVKSNPREYPGCFFVTVLKEC